MKFLRGNRQVDILLPPLAAFETFSFGHIPEPVQEITTKRLKLLYAFILTDSLH